MAAKYNASNVDFYYQTFSFIDAKIINCSMCHMETENY